MEGACEAEMLKRAPEALLVENGIISAVGSLKECLKAVGNSIKKIKMINLCGSCLMPSFIDSHGHFVMNGQISVCADLSACESFDDIITVLRKYIKDNRITEKNAVLGFGYDHNFLKEQAHPDKQILDKVSKKIPIMVLHVSAHLACANSAALRLAGIDEKTKEPSGGVIGRVGNTKEPSGYFEEAAMTEVSETIGKKLKKDILKILAGMQKDYLSNGITTVQDGATTSKDMRFLRFMSAIRMLKVDVVSYPLMSEEGISIMKKYGKKYSKYCHGLRVGGYKFVLDGSPQGRSAWLSKPYEGSDSYVGYPWMKDCKLKKMIARAVSENKQVLAHCNGDAACEQYIKAYVEACDAVSQHKHISKAADLRPVMIHCQTVRKDQLERMADIGMIASFFVGHVWYWGDIHIKNLGKERGSNISPAKTAIKNGVVITFHQDTPVTKPDMLHSVWCAVNRRSKGGEIIGEHESISVYEALKAVTINAAYGYHEENEKGSIRVGKKADFVILDKSPFEVSKERINEIKVLKTIKDGKVVYRK